MLPMIGPTLPNDTAPRRTAINVWTTFPPVKQPALPGRMRTGVGSTTLEHKLCTSPRGDSIHCIKGEEETSHREASRPALADPSLLSASKENVVSAHLVLLTIVASHCSDLGENLVGNVACPGIGLDRLGLSLGDRDDKDSERNGEKRRAAHNDERELPRGREANDNANDEGAKRLDCRAKLFHAGCTNAKPRVGFSSLLFSEELQNGRKEKVA